jgi:transposase
VERSPVTDLEAENARLKQENARLRLEKEIMKKAAAYFARESL